MFILPHNRKRDSLNGNSKNICDPLGIIAWVDRRINAK